MTGSLLEENADSLASFSLSSRDAAAVTNQLVAMLARERDPDIAHCIWRALRHLDPKPEIETQVRATLAALLAGQDSENMRSEVNEMIAGMHPSAADLAAIDDVDPLRMRALLEAARRNSPVSAWLALSPSRR